MRIEVLIDVKTILGEGLARGRCGMSTSNGSISSTASAPTFSDARPTDGMGAPEPCRR